MPGLSPAYFWKDEKMKFLSTIILVFFFGCVTSTETYVCDVEYTNGERDTIEVSKNNSHGIRPYVTGRGCLYDGYSYVCGVRKIVKCELKK